MLKVAVTYVEDSENKITSSFCVDNLNSPVRESKNSYLVIQCRLKPRALIHIHLSPKKKKKHIMAVISSWLLLSCSLYFD